jgi:nucleoside-diphosphate kinase
MSTITVAIIKPDLVENGLVGAVISLIERADFKLGAMRIMTLTPHGCAELYRDHVDKPHYKRHSKFMQSGPCVALMLMRSGDDAVAHWRKLIGATNPAEAEPGTIRSVYGTDLPRNAVHGSDSDAAAEREFSILFGR